jgi:iron-sulfur cluster assembly accessory protein
MITLTDTARTHIKRQLIDMDHNYLRFGVRGGGCAGFEYYWEPVKDMTPADDELVVEIALGLYLIVDPASQMYILGSTVDYVTDMLNSQIVVKNPLAKSSCGCGTSISL